MTTIPACAHNCPLVLMLLADRARMTGTTPAVQHVTWGLTPHDEEADDVQPD